MKAVLYTEDMEPITVIELPYSLWRFRYGVYRVAVPHATCDCAAPKDAYCRVINIFVEQLNWHGIIKPMFIIKDQDVVAAFGLSSVPLAGQQKEWRTQFQRGFISGLMASLERGA